MKKTILVLIIILCLFLTSCADEQPVEEDEKETVTGPSTVKEESKAIEEIPIKASMSTELKELIEKANTVESLKYFYQSSEGGNMDVYVMGTKMKQEFDPHFIEGVYYDTYYIDLSKKTVAGYCESDSTFYCEDPSVTVTRDFNDFITETPFDILKLITSGDVKPGTMIDGRSTVIAEIETEEGIMKIWLWDYKGIPIRYEIWDNDEKIRWVDYKNLAINVVKSSELIH
ncbi:hypothetical protein KY343_00185 [Candidatus Woesearchaeota archaeon]|nr:hypothetical protein [Candidatus Woesearchaeota archaeon]